MGELVYIFHASIRERAALERDLRRMDLDVRCFDSGAALMRTAAELGPALVLWDIDGEPPFGARRRVASALGCPVVAITGQTTRVRTESERALTLLLPYERWRLVPVVARVLSHPSDARPVHVHVADDDEVFQEIVGYQLALQQWKVSRSCDGLDTLARAKDGGIDVLLVDLNLPHKNGFEILESLDEHDKGALRVVMVSEQGQDDNVVRCFELGAHDFVAKPLSPRVLVSRVQRLLRRA